MLFLSKFHVTEKVRILGKHFPGKLFSGQVKNEDYNIISKVSKKIMENFLIPPLEGTQLKAIDEVTGISIKMGHTAWAKISTQTFKVLEWNFQSHPEGFRNMDEASILKLASSIKKILPASDLYVMEKMRSREESKNLNEVRLTSMLMVLLNNFTNDSQEDGKVVFQKESVMNALHKLLIGNERVSARKVFEVALQEANEFKETDASEHTFGNCLKSFKLENLEFYDQSSITQQECLSFVLLLTLSFADVFIFQSVGSIKKIQLQTKHKKVQRLSLT